MNNLEALKELVKKAGYTDDIPVWVDDIKTSLKALDIIKSSLRICVDKIYNHDNSGFSYYLVYEGKDMKTEYKSITKEFYDLFKKELDNGWVAGPYFEI